MRLTDVTSILAIILSIINLFLIVKRDFLKKEPIPILEIEITKCQIRYGHGKTQAQVLIDLCVIPRKQYNGVRKITFEIPEEHYYTYEGTGFFRYFFKYVDNIYAKPIFSDYNYTEYNEFMTTTNKDHMKEIYNIESQKDIPFRFTLTEQFDGYRFSEGYDDFPSDGVILKITDFFGNEYVKVLNFNIG